MMNLYELTSELKTAFENLTVDENTGEVYGFESIDTLDIAFEQKAEAYALTIKNLLAFSDAIKMEIDALKSRADAAKKKVEQLKTHLAESMQAVGKDKISTPKVALSFRKSTSVLITDETLIRDDLFNVKMTKTPNKTAISKLLKAGESVPGAEIIESQNIQIK